MASLASSNSTRRLVRAASISTCAEVIIYAGKLAAMAEAFPASPEITVTAALIIAVGDVNCTAAEITSLVSAEASLVEAVATVEIALEAVQDQLMSKIFPPLSSQLTFSPRSSDRLHPSICSSRNHSSRNPSTSTSNTIYHRSFRQDQKFQIRVNQQDLNRTRKDKTNRQIDKWTNRQDPRHGTHLTIINE